MRELHSRFIHESSLTFSPQRTSYPPVTPHARVPLTPQNSWQNIDTPSGRCLVKTMSFVDNEQRNDFLVQLFAFERQCGHTATVTSTNGAVSISLCNDAGVPLDEDRAYCIFVDDLYRDVSFSFDVP